jgi:hypothetical protein
VSAFLQAQGLEGTPVRVELLEAAADPAADSAPGPVPAPAAETGRVVDVVEVKLAADGELAGVRFDLPGLESPGRRRLTVRVVPPAGERNRADDLQSAEVEVVDRVTQVLLVAGGPTRDYQFIRNVLQRDKSFAIDVLLATARRGASQDARRILEAFPATTEELSAYDAIVAFDVDWRILDPAAQSRLERWVSRESGGLFMVAGSVSMDSWLSDPACGPLRTLLPVEPRRAGQLIVEEPTGFSEPHPLSFTREGLDAEFLWLDGNRASSEAAWREFPGVYSCFDARSAKPGATVYATVAPPGDTARGDGSIYMAGQLYGAGTVFHLGSGELWRLRSLDETLHERLVTQLVRHVSQGRLLAGSRRARLLVDRDRYAVGAGVVVRVVAADGESAVGGGQPECRVIGPDGAMLRVPLTAEPGRPGVLQGMFVAGREGGWRIDVTLPAESGADGETLSRRIQARLPDRELERPRLDRGALEQVATITGGTAAFLADDGWDDARSRALARRRLQAPAQHHPPRARRRSAVCRMDPPSSRPPRLTRSPVSHGHRLCPSHRPARRPPRTARFRAPRDAPLGLRGGAGMGWGVRRDPVLEPVVVRLVGRTTRRGPGRADGPRARGARMAAVDEARRAAGGAAGRSRPGDARRAGPPRLPRQPLHGHRTGAASARGL